MPCPLLVDAMNNGIEALEQVRLRAHDTNVSQLLAQGQKMCNLLFPVENVRIQPRMRVAMEHISSMLAPQSITEADVAGLVREEILVD